jgi:purine-binding chemotaxis protein CheW
MTKAATATATAPRSSDPRSSDVVQILTIGLGGEVFALPAGIVREILDVVTVTTVPTARPFVGGLINVRGRVVPLADLRLRFGMKVTERTIDTRIVVIEIEVDGEVTIVGILADKVYEVAELDLVKTEEVPRVGMRWRPEFVRAIGRRNNDFLMVLDIGRVFTSVEQPYVAES